MIQLYYSPGACSLGPHIILEELKMPYEAIKVDLKTHTVDTEDYYAINPSGAVPGLVLEDGRLLTQNGAILMYLGDLKPDLNLIPIVGTFERIRAQEWLFFISTDVHKTFGPLFASHKFVDSDGAVQELKQHTIKNLEATFQAVEKKLQANQFALGEAFSVVDAYLYVVYRWAEHVKVPLDNCPNYIALMQRIAERPSVKNILKQEGLSG